MKFRILLMIFVFTIISSCELFTNNEKNPEFTVWEGTWQSSLMPIIQGTLQVELPNQLNKENQYKAPASITYASTSPFRSGEMINIEFDVVFKESGDSTGKGQIDPNRDNYVSTFKAKTQDGQIITYEASIEINTTEITGKYESISPVDMGIFSLSKM